MNADRPRSKGTDLTPARFSHRAYAWVIDAVPHALVPFFAARAGGTAFGIAGFLVTGIVWSIVPEARGGMSLGKRLLGIRVVDHAGDGPIGLSRAALRWLVKYGACGVLPVGYLWYFRNPSRRAWQDLAAGTSVIDVVSPA